MGENFSAAVREHLIPTSQGSTAPSTPLLRPTLSRASSMQLVDADDSFTSLTLLDALVVLDSHLDLAKRQLSRKGQEWRSNVQATASSVKRSAEDMLNQGMQLQRRRTRQRVNDASTHDDRIDIDREVARFKARVGKRVETLRQRWKDERVVSLRDKLSFFMGVELVLFSALLVGFRPQWIPNVYTILSLYLMPLRIYEYRKKHFSYFLFDLCYLVNAMTLAYIWIFPNSPMMFVACYCLAHGPLCTAIATWRNSLVFHSVDKVTSLFIHIYPPFVFTTIRHFYPNVHQDYPALNELPRLNIWRSILFSSLAYLVWQIAYYYGIIVARKERIEREGRMTSFTWMLNNKRSLIGKTLAKIPPQHREMSFMGGQLVYTIVTMSPSVIWLYDSKFLSVLWLITFFSVSVWNGASFYFRVMANFSQVAALKKELDELQRDAEGRKTPATPASTLGGDDGNVPADISLGPSAVSSPMLNPADKSIDSVASTIDGQPDASSVKKSTTQKEELANVPDLKLDARTDSQDLASDSSSQSGKGDAGSDTSAVVIDREEVIGKTV